jgi:two-component system, NtrC family, nitrogen regulation sensor histidine kinase GlnL
MNAVFPRIIENLSTAVLLLNDALHLDYINPAGEMMFAVSGRQVMGQPVQSLLPGDESLREAMWKALRQGHPFTDREKQLHLPGDKHITVDCTVTPLAVDHSDRGLLIELIQVDRHLRITREEHLIAQYEATRALLNGLAHEIKNPLGGLRGAAQLLERELTDASLKEYTRIIIGEADRLRNLVNRMLGPNALPHKRPLNIHEVLEHVRQLVLAERPADIKILTDYDPSIPEFQGDPDRLIQAVLNIVRNAMQALQGSGDILLRTRVLRHVAIGHQRHKLVARIDVTDNGPGIPPDMIEHIFYPMITGRPEGTGLGLPIAQALIKQHGGLIECASQPGQTIFTLLLPLGVQP